ncbi:MAG: serine/threonine protein kinase [Pyrinomonadaceae bacterium]|nr:serine/threonine protein kinase [Pyrinomonadaceae bacterium]
MNSDTWQQVEDLLNDALELEPASRRKFLEGISADDLRREVESLLDAESGAEEFLASPAVALSASFFIEEDLPDALAGQKIGSYKIVRELGRGGMGAVYLGERDDGKFSQRAAIKLLKRELNTADIRRRFAHERQILSRLEHPNIARLLDAGTTDDGLPFLVMEYVEGMPVDSFCAETNLSLHGRLQLFRIVCETVAFAHRNLVIHRDLKPSNILVTRDGVPKLLDFGISKLLTPDFLDDSEHTVTKLGAMTPEYASPEQLRGESVTTATDVYSLGVILYELLTTHRPFEFKKQNTEEIIHAVCTTDPQKPSEALTRDKDEPDNKTKDQRPKTKDQLFKTQTLKGDLDNIALKALKKEPERRYSSVEQFAEDIRRHLADLPVMARPDTLSYRATKFVSRNKVAVLAAALIMLSLLGGVVATIWQARRAEASRARAERRFNDVRQLSNALLNDIAPKIERLEGSTEARQALVAQSLKYLDSLAVESTDDLTLQAELAAAYEKVGVLQGDSRKPSLSDFRGAIVSLEKAQQMRRRLLEINPKDVENRRLLAENLRLLALRKMTQSDVEGGFRDSKEALQIYEKLVGEQPESLELQKAFLEAQTEDATSHINRNRFAEAIPPLQQAAGKLEELRRTNPGDTETERILAKCLVSLGLALSWESRQPEAEAEMARAVTIAESLVARFPNDTNLKQDLWKFYESASSIYEEIDDARAFELCEKSRRVVEEIIAADPANAQARHNLSKSFSRLGISASNLGKPVEALGFLKRAMAIVLELQEKDPLNRGYDRDVSALYIRIGVAREKQRDFTGAIAAYQKSAELYEKQLADDAANTIAQRDLAIAHRRAGKVHEEIAKTANLQIRQTHLAAAKENYRQALDALLKAQAQKALPEVNLKLLEEVRTAVEELEKMR